MNIAKLKVFWAKEAPKILTIGGVVGFGGSLALACWGTKKAIRAIDQESIRLGRDLTKKEKFKVSWRYFTPTTMLFLASGGAVVASLVKSSKTIAELLTLYSSTQASLFALKDEVKEVVGETKADKIVRKSIIDEKPEQQPQKAPVVIVTGKDTLFYDVPSKREFHSNYTVVKDAFANIAIRLPEDMLISWNELFMYIDSPELEPMGDTGEISGFDVNQERNIMPKIYSDFDFDRGIPITYVDYKLYKLDWKHRNHG